MLDILKTFKSIGLSFWNAWEGLLYTLYTQQHMRFHFFAAILVVSFAVIFELPPVEMSLISILIILIMGLEILNTSVESALDYVADEIRPLVKRSKDSAAGAVLICAFGSLIVFTYLLLPRFLELIRMESWFIKHSADIASLIILGIALVIFVCVRGSSRVTTVIMMFVSVASGFAFAQICGSRREIPAFIVLASGSIMLINAVVRSSRSEFGFKKEDILLHPRHDLPSIKLIVFGEFAGFLLWMAFTRII